MLSAHKKSVVELRRELNDRTASPAALLPTLASDAKARAFERERQRRSIVARLARVETNYDAHFARKQRTTGYLDKKTLEEGVRKVNDIAKRANRWLLKPHGSFMQTLDVTTMVALLFTAVVSPYEIAFLEAGDTLVLEVANWFVLLVFAVGMVCSFFLPYNNPVWMGGALVRDHKKIAWRYITTWFFFDLISTLPLDLMASVQDDGSDETSNALRTVRGVRLVRLVRLFRLIKLGRLLRAQRIIARIAERAEHRSEFFNISYTFRTALFWCGVLIFVTHWFCCSWGILSLVQASQRTPEFVESLSPDCLDTVVEELTNATSMQADCLLPCEIEALAEIQDLRENFVANEEPWLCRRINEGLISGRSSAQVYFHLLYNEGFLKNPGGRTGRSEENIMFFALSYLFLVLRTLFVGAIAGAFANAKPLTKAWQARMDHLNLYLKEMNAPPDLRSRTRQYLRNTRDLELKRSFGSLYSHFSRELAGEMMSHMTSSIVKGVRLFNGCEGEFLRDLASKMVYEAFDRGEKVVHPEPTLCMVMQGTLVRGGMPFGMGKCIGEDVLLHSEALRDRRIPIALTYLETCLLTKNEILSVAEHYPLAKKALRMTTFKIAIYRSTQMVAHYVEQRGAFHAAAETDKGGQPLTIVGEALSNLGEDVIEDHNEVHTFVRTINGGVPLRGLAREQQYSSDLNLSTKSQEAIVLAEDTPRANNIIIDEKGDLVEDMAHGAGRYAQVGTTPLEKLSESMKAEMSELREENRKAMKALQTQLATMVSHVKGEPPKPRQRPKPRMNGLRRLHSVSTMSATTESSPQAGVHPSPALEA